VRDFSSAEGISMLRRMLNNKQDKIKTGQDKMTRCLFTEDEESLVETKATRGESLVRLAHRLPSSGANTSSALNLFYFDFYRASCCSLSLLYHSYRHLDPVRRACVNGRSRHGFA
jgi:hypothetical protein